MLAKSCVLCCVSHNGNGDDQGVGRADTARAHAQWRNLVASHEATNTLYREMCLVPYLPGGMVVAIAVNFVTFYYIMVVELTKGGSDEAQDSIVLSMSNELLYLVPELHTHTRSLSHQ